ncbi:MAG: hypothetical protein WDO74_04470 [Pseudomonadota bacterium]
MVSEEELAQYDVLVAGDNEWQREARLLQAHWRERHFLPVGLHGGRPLGSRLAMPFAKERLATFMTPTVQDVVLAEVLDSVKSAGKVFEDPRIFDNLLTSQALCFNLFGELQRDLGLASRVVARLLNDPTLEVTAVEFEYSPGRSDPRFTADQSAFDVFIDYTSRDDRRFLGIEVKYAETMGGKVARHRARYDEVAHAMGCFVPESLARLRQKPLEQLWRNHLLAGSFVLDPTSDFKEYTFVLLYPSQNLVVQRAAEVYRTCLSDRAVFTAWTLESVLDALAGVGAGTWAQAVTERYLG